MNETIGALFLWTFIVIKITGTSLAGWSAWWVLLPIVPVLSLLVKRWGL